LKMEDSHLEDVDSRVSHGEPVAEGAVVVLQDGGVVVQQRQLVARVAQERAVPTCSTARKSAKTCALFHGVFSKKIYFIIWHPSQHGLELTVTCRVFTATSILKSGFFLKKR